MNHFQLLELDQRYDLDQMLLKARYLSKQSIYHPDKAPNKNLRKDYLEKSMQLNEAYKILKDDYFRAEYLLKLKGQEFNADALKTKLTPHELEEIMEMHEALDETDDLQELEAMKSLKIQEKKIVVNQLACYFAQEKIAKALDLTIRLKYLTNLVGNIKLKIKHANHINQ